MSSLLGIIPQWKIHRIMALMAAYVWELDNNTSFAVVL